MPKAVTIAGTLIVSGDPGEGQQALETKPEVYERSMGYLTCKPPQIYTENLGPRTNT